MAQGNLCNTKRVGGGIQEYASTSALDIESILAVTVSAL
jgi:hypothetical protein